MTRRTFVRRSVCRLVVAPLATLGILAASLHAGEMITPRAEADAAPTATVKSTAAQALTEARRTRSAVEIGSLRREDSETFANADGTYTTVQHLRPVRARVAGAWSAVDPTLKRDGSGVVRPFASTADVRIAGGDGPFLRIGRAGRTLALSWPEPLPEPVLDGDTARFVDALPGVDLLVRADVDGASHTFVIKSRAAAENPALDQLTLGLGGSLTVEDNEQGGLEAVDAGSNGAVLEAARPLMWDSTRASGKATVSDDDGAGGPGEGAKVAEVDATVTDTGMTLEPDAGMLAADDTVFPVYIDPVWKTVKASAWSMVSSGYPTTAYYKFDGKSTEGVGRCEVAKDADCVKNQTKRLFYRMSTSAFAGKAIISAEFVGYETHAYNCDSPSIVDLWRTKGFTSSSTWNSTSDNWTEKVASRDVAYCSRTPVEFNATSAVRDAAANSWSTTTFGLRAASEAGMTWWKRFADDAYLRVNYNSPPSQPKTAELSMSPGGKCVYSPAPSVNRLPTLYSVLRDPEGDKLTAQYQVGWDHDGDGVITSQWVSSQTAQKASGSTFSLTIPGSIGLPQNARAIWAVRAWDGNRWSPWSHAGSASSCYFRYDSSVPAAPTTTSAAYPPSDPENPEDPWIDGVGRYGSFTVDSEATDVTRYTYQLNDEPVLTATPASPGAPVTVEVAPSRAGLNYLRVQAFDAANNASATDQYMFRVKAGSAAKAAWGLDEPDGSADLDDASGAFPATTHGGVTLGVAGVSKTAMQLNGTDGYAATSGPVLDTSKPFAVAAWARLPVTKPDHAAVIATQVGSQRSGFELYYSASLDRWVFNRYDADAATATIVRAQSTSPATGGEWTHLVGAYDPVRKTITLYVNGVAAQTTAYTKPWNATGAVQLGAGWYGERDSFFSGELDDVRLFDRIVSGEEAQDLSTQRPLLRARWTLNDAGDAVPPATTHYRLDEPAGAVRAEDVTGALPAGAHGGLTFGVTGRTGNAARFDGTTGYAATTGPAVDTGASFSVTAWAKLPATKPGHAGIIATQRGTQRSGFELYYSAYYDRWIFNRYDSDTTAAKIVRAQSTTVPEPGAWTHLAGVYDAPAQELRLYVDGVLAQSVPYTKPWNATGPVQLGAGWYGERDSFFTGDADDVRIFDEPITGSEIAALAGGSPEAVTADSSSWGRHGTLHGNARVEQGGGWVGEQMTGIVLDGDGDHVSTDGPVLDTSASFTVAGWAATAGRPDHPVALFSQAGTVNAAFTVRYDPQANAGLGAYQIEMPDRDTTEASRPTAEHPGIPTANDWNHVAVVYDAFQDQMRLYVNGGLAQVEDQVSWRFHVIGFNATGAFQLGRTKADGAWGEYWPGAIDDVWAYEGVLPDEEIERRADPLDELPSDPGS